MGECFQCAVCEPRLQEWHGIVCDALCAQSAGGVSIGCTSVIVGGGPAGKVVLGDIFMRSYYRWGPTSAARLFSSLLGLARSV